jgi:hypothetical protein
MSSLDLLLESINQFIHCEKEKKHYSYNIKFPTCYKIYRISNLLPLSYNDCLLLIYYIHLQQSFLERKGYGFFKLGLEDIIMIESSIENTLMFAYMNSSHIKQVNSSGEIVFMTPFSNNKGFIAPEILEIKTIPSRVSYKCFYYSLGLLIIDCIKEKGIVEKDKEKEKEKENIMKNVKNTKLYWLLQRLMLSDPLKRLLLLV